MLLTELELEMRSLSGYICPTPKPFPCVLGLVVGDPLCGLVPLTPPRRRLIKLEDDLECLSFPLDAASAFLFKCLKLFFVFSSRGVGERSSASHTFEKAPFPSARLKRRDTSPGAGSLAGWGSDLSGDRVSLLGKEVMGVGVC